jgi:hypothetical protein
LSRFRIFTLLAALAALTIAFAACGGGGGSDDPQQVLDDATFEGVESGNLEVSLGVNAEGDEGGNFEVDLSGPFQGNGSDDLPQLAMTATAKGTARGKDIDFEGGLVALPGRAYVNYEGVEYEVDPTTYGFVKSSFEEAQNQGGEGNPADVTACQEAAEGLAVADFADQLSSEGDVEVDGTTTTKVSGNLNSEGAADALIELAEDPACSTQLEAAGSGSLDELKEARNELAGAVKKAHVEVYVGDDDIIRKAVGELTIEPKDSKGEKIEADFEVVLSGVNEEQEISAPSGAEPLSDLFLKLGVNPAELVEATSSGEGLGELLERLIEADASASGGSGGSGSSGGGGGGRQAYLECLKDARTSADLQQCASMIQ